MWFAGAGLRSTPTVAGPNFSDSGLLLQAATDGQGIALGSRTLAARDLAAGRLVIAHPFSLKSRSSYHLVCSDTNLAWPKVRAFNDWLTAEADAYRLEMEAAGSVIALASRAKGRA